MLRVEHKIIIQGCLKNVIAVHVFFKKIDTGSSINNFMEKNSHEHYKVKKVHKQIAQLRVKPVEPHMRSNGQSPPLQDFSSSYISKNQLLTRRLFATLF